MTHQTSHEPSHAAAYQGQPGAYSEEAAWALVGPGASLLPCPSLVTMLDSLAEGRARHAVLPVENSLAGNVPRAYELLLDRGLVVGGETRVRIDHVLVGTASALPQRLRRVLSHPVALDQCTQFFRDNPEIEAVPVFDTAGAVGMVMAEASGEVAAIASRRAARQHRATILAEHIQDHDENWTRFLLVRPPTPADSIAQGRRAVAAFRLRHDAGTLCRALETLAASGINLTKIESRPIHGRPFEYAFLIEMTAPDSVQDWQEHLGAFRLTTTDCRVLGAY